MCFTSLVGVVNRGLQPVEALQVRAVLNTADGTGIAEAVDRIMGYVLAPGQFAPFSLRFGQGQSPQSNNYTLELIPTNILQTTELVSPDVISWTYDNTAAPEGQVYVTVTAENTGDTPVRTPLAIVSAFDAAGDMVAAAYSPASMDVLEPGGTAVMTVLIAEAGGQPETFEVNVQAPVCDTGCGMTLTHIFFGLHCVLVQSQKLKPGFAQALADYMAGQYGGNIEAWLEAHQQIENNRSDYYIDLNLSGDEGMQDYYEGLFRVTRALFTLTGTAEPPKPEITHLSKTLPTLGFSAPGAAFPEVENTLKNLRRYGIEIGVISHALTEQAKAILHASHLLEFISASIVGVDTAERFEKDMVFLLSAARLASVDPANCLIVDRDTRVIDNAKRAGMQALCLQRDAPDAEDHTIRDLTALLSLYADTETNIEDRPD